MSLLGPSVEIPDEILIESFGDYTVFYKANILRESVSAAKNRLELPPALLTKLTNLLSRFGQGRSKQVSVGQARTTPSSYTPNHTFLIVRLVRLRW